MFIHFNGKLVNTDVITNVEIKDYSTHREIIVRYSDNTFEIVTGDASSVIDDLYPSVLEGSYNEYGKTAWIIHNIIGHPLSEIFSLLKMNRMSKWIHDVTLPKPKA